MARKTAEPKGNVQLAPAAIAMIMAEENLVIDAQFLIQDLLDQQNLTRADLAKLTGVSRARLSQLMSSEANPTLRTLARLFSAMDSKLSLRAESVNPVDSFIRPSDDGWEPVEGDGEISRQVGMHAKRAQVLLLYAEECSYVANDNIVINDLRVSSKECAK